VLQVRDAFGGIITTMIMSMTMTAISGSTMMITHDPMGQSRRNKSKQWEKQGAKHSL